MSEETSRSSRALTSAPNEGSCHRLLPTEGGIMLAPVKRVLS